MPQTKTSHDEFAQRLQTALRSKSVQPPASEANVSDLATAQPNEDAGPVGDGDHIVRAGQCTSSIAKETGHFWETIWTDPANTDLRETRKDPNVLLPGDRVSVMPLRPKSESGATQMRHRFVRRGEPSFFRLRVLDDDRNPRGNEEYVLTIDQLEFRGTTDPDGVLQVNIPGNARRGRLTIGRDSYDLDLHALEPVESVGGAQARLKNLGFYDGPTDGKTSDRLQASISEYQRERSLEVTGQMDDTTCETLKKEHRS